MALLAAWIGGPSAASAACQWGTPTANGQCRGYLTAGTGSSFAVPSDWTTTNTIEAIGGGGGAGMGGSGNDAAAGGGGGGYSRITNVNISGTVSYAIGGGGAGAATAGATGGAGGDTWFVNTSTLLAKGGAGGTGAGGGGSVIGGVGGAASAGVGSVRYAGGQGYPQVSQARFGGGGGAAGPSGAGANGGGGGDQGGANYGGGGGGGASGGTAGATVAAGVFATGGVGGNGPLGSGGGAGGGGGGSNGGGGGGGTRGGVATGGAGGLGTDWDGSHGAGGGGGSAARSGSPDMGGAGGSFGGGGGASADATPGANGAAGIIVITYAPTAPPPPSGVAGTTNYTYDALGRLTCSATPDGYYTSYILDNADNRTNVVRNKTACQTSGQSQQPPTVGDVGSTSSPVPVPENTGSNQATQINANITSGAASSLLFTTTPGHGTATSSGLTFNYTPANGYTGKDSFRYQATGAAGTSATPATVWLSVNAPSQTAPTVSSPPLLDVPQNASNVNVPLSISGTWTSLAVATQPGHGQAASSGTAITYTPNNPAGYIGSDSFTYTASNGSASSSAASVPIRVGLPKTGNVTASVGENAAATSIPLNITNGTASSVMVSSAASHGTASPGSGASLTYKPTAGYTGPDSFTYTATNAAGTSSPAGTVSVTVTAGPTVNNVSATVPFNSSNNNITLSITPTPTSVAVPVQPSHGTTSVSGTTIKYTPTTGSSGSDSFKYTATNAGGTSNQAAASITVSPAPGPTANPDTMALTSTFQMTQGYATGCINPLTNDISPAGYALTVTGVTQPTWAANFSSQSSVSSNQVCYYSSDYATFQDQFTYTISDGHGGTSTATVTVNVTAQ